LRTTNRLLRWQAAYIAGIVDGEGTVTLTRYRREGNRRAVVSVSSTEPDLLRHVRLLIGAGRISMKARRLQHHSPGFAYTITSRQALALLAQIAPYLQTYKAQRARLLLEDYVHLTPRNGRYTPEQRDARDSFELRFFAIKTRAGISRVRHR
jgi:hypothetical protein